MHKPSWIMALAVTTLTVAAAAQGTWKKLDNQPVPAITAKTWLNTPAGEDVVASLKGKVWLLEFCATT